MKTWFITGIGRGLGLSLARAVLASGDTVIGTVRSQKNAALDPHERLHVLELDMGDAAAIAPAVDAAFSKAGRLDVLVNNAGYGLLGALEYATDDEARRLFEVDFFGPMRLIRAALPRLRAQGSGHIVNVTSIAGRAPGVASALYSAAKFALEGLSTALASELAPFGIRVTAVAPGAFRTDFLTDHSLRQSETNDAYAASVGKGLAAFAAMNGRQVGDPDRAARAIIEAVGADSPPLNLLLGSDALQRARTRLDQLTAEMDAWARVTLGTDHVE